MDLTVGNIQHYLIQKLSSIYSQMEAKKTAEILLKEVLGKSAVHLVVDTHELISEKNRIRIKNAINELMKYKPIQYVLGKAEFYGMELMVNNSTLIPRPETEELTHWVIKENKHRDVSILDIGTGSGCIAIVLAKNCKNTTITAIDISKETLVVAQKNANKHNVQIDFQTTDVLCKNNWTCLGPFDIIISNPPYVLNSEKINMSSHVLKYEPVSALFVRDDEPLIFYEAIAAFAMKKLFSKGWVYVEINEIMGLQVCGLFHKKEFINIELRKDLNGKDRMLRCQKP